MSYTLIDGYQTENISPSEKNVIWIVQMKRMIKIYVFQKSLMEKLKYIIKFSIIYITVFVLEGATLNIIPPKYHSFNQRSSCYRISQLLTLYSLNSFLSFFGT